jgi:dihydrofolate reductase
MSLDGVVQDPDGQEGFTRGGWFRTFGGADLEPWGELMQAEAAAMQAMLLGRRSDAWFAARWAAREGDWADRLNGLPKYVVSPDGAEPEWANATALRGDPVEEVERLKRELDGQIVVYASYELGHVLLERDLVDELRIVVFPVVLGAGTRLFGATSAWKELRLIGSRTLGSLVLLTYEVVRAYPGVSPRSDGG